MSKRSDEIRNKYIQNPPEGMTADDIRHMSEDDLLDMDYFLTRKLTKLLILASLTWVHLFHNVPNEILVPLNHI